MKRLSLLSLTFLLALVPARVFAKAATTRVIIEGNHLKLEITNPKTLAQFHVWSGPGTSSNGISSQEAQSFIVDWSRPLAEEPQGLARYQVSFYGIFPRQNGESLLYVVTYAYDPAAGQGYVYLPGKNDPWYGLDVSRILRGVEGKWFHAWSAWDDVAGPLIREGLRAANSFGEQATCFAIRRYQAKRVAPDSDVTYLASVSTCIPASNVRFTAEPARYHPHQPGEAPAWEK